MNIVGTHLLTVQIWNVAVSTFLMCHRKHICGRCGKSFTKSSSLTGQCMDTLIHSGKKSDSCEIICQRFRTAVSQRRSYRWIKKCNEMWTLCPFPFSGFHCPSHCSLFSKLVHYYHTLAPWIKLYSYHRTDSKVHHMVDLKRSVGYLLWVVIILKRIVGGQMLSQCFRQVDCSSFGVDS